MKNWDLNIVSIFAGAICFMFLIGTVKSCNGIIQQNTLCGNAIEAGVVELVPKSCLD